MNRPEINVTPLIDVLLVLLIIFMCVAPLKPRTFKARVPSEPTKEAQLPNVKALAVIVGPDHSLRLNAESGLGTAEETDKLISRLKAVFDQRIANGDVSDSFENTLDRPFTDKAERMVFIKAPRTLDYGSVAKVVDAVKLAGAYPISLQIDGLE